MEIFHDNIDSGFLILYKSLETVFIRGRLQDDVAEQTLAAFFPRDLCECFMGELQKALLKVFSSQIAVAKEQEDEFWVIVFVFHVNGSSLGLLRPS